MKTGTIEIIFKSGRRSYIPDCVDFRYIPKLDKWAVSSGYFKTHEKLFDNSKIVSIGFFVL